MTKLDEILSEKHIFTLECCFLGLFCFVFVIEQPSPQQYIYPQQYV